MISFIKKTILKQKQNTIKKNYYHERVEYINLEEEYIDTILNYMSKL